MTQDMHDVTPERFKGDVGFLFNYLKHKKPKEIMKHIPLHCTGVDVGAGCGQYTEVLNALGYRVIAVEPNRELICGAKCHKEYCSGANMPFTDKKFDFSYVINVLHHTDEKTQILQEMKRVSNTIIISEPNKDNFLVKMFIQKKLSFDDYASHLTETDLKEIIEKSGLVLKKFYHKSLFKVPGVFLWAVCE